MDGPGTEDRNIFNLVGAVHPLQDVVGGGLEGKVEEAADVRMHGHHVEQRGTAEARFQRTEADAMDGRRSRERRKGGEQVGEAASGIVVEGEIAAGDDEFAVPCRKEGAGARQHVVEGNGNGRPAKARDDAEGAPPRTAVLYFQIGA